jgi:hypothetical protein
MRHEAARAGEAVAGPRVVLTLLKRVKAASGVLALCAVQAPVKEVLDITGFTGIHSRTGASVLQGADVAQQVTDRAVAVAGFGLGAVDRLVRRQTSTGGLGEPVEDHVERVGAGAGSRWRPAARRP